MKIPSELLTLTLLLFRSFLIKETNVRLVLFTTSDAEYLESINKIANEPSKEGLCFLNLNDSSTLEAIKAIDPRYFRPVILEVDEDPYNVSKAIVALGPRYDLTVFKLFAWEPCQAFNPDRLANASFLEDGRNRLIHLCVDRVGAERNSSLPVGRRNSRKLYSFRDEQDHQNVTLKFPTVHRLDSDWPIVSLDGNYCLAGCSSRVAENGRIVSHAASSRSIRSALGIPTQPHPGLKVLIKKQEVPRRFADRAWHEKFKILDDSAPHHLNHHLTGHGILIHPTHALANSQSVAATIGYDDWSHDTHNYLPLPGRIDASNPLDSGYNNGGKGGVRRLRKLGSNLNGTPLAVYRLVVGHQPEKARLSSGVPIPELETNLTEYGRDCFIHGFGAVHEKHLPGMEQVTDNKMPAIKMLTEAEINNFNRTDRVHVKAPLEPIRPEHCRPDHRCQFTVRKPYSHCPSAAAGAPIFCGPKQKLTYMTEHNTASGECGDTGYGYHIPRLVPDINRSMQKQTGD